MHSIQIAGQHYTGPSTFEELTQEQFLGVVQLMQATEKNPSAKWALLPFLFRIPVKALDMLNEVQRVDLLHQTTDFLYEEKQLSPKQLIEKVPVRIGNTLTIRHLYGPGDGLKHLTFGEFMAAEQKLEAFYRDGKDENINAFCGILYRPSSKERKKHSDRRVVFVESLIDRYSLEFANILPHVKTAIALQYHGAKALFPKLYQHVFPEKDESVEESGGDETPTNKRSASLTWLNAAISLAKEDVTKVKEIENTSLHMVLKFLDDTIRNDKDLKAKLRSMKKK